MADGTAVAQAHPLTPSRLREGENKERAPSLMREEESSCSPETRVRKLGSIFGRFGLASLSSAIVSVSHLAVQLF